MVEEVSQQRNRLERQLNESQSAIAALEDQVSSYQARSASGAEPEARRSYSPDLILGMVQEFRTPMTSIVGYIDLLLDEAAGILGEMQRKFLQRVAANISRMTFMLDDITRLAALDTDRFALSPEPVDVVNLIEESITNSTHQFREKGLTVNLNLDDEIPPVRADRDAVTQIINELLINAYLASPPDGQVFIGARRQQVTLSGNDNFTNPADSLLVSVEDRGGGILPEDLPRVFARKYRAENPLVQGLGDTGVGLSIAKTLAEAHGGALWLESRENVGSIFYFALPIEPVLEPEG
jgi:signal transduction histidine kinase